MSEGKQKEETRLWLEQAEEHWQDANWLLEGRRYSACLYSCHQVLESLARQAEMKLPKDWDKDLAEITRHYWRVRYPDFRRMIYKSREKILPTYEKTKEIYLWLQKELSKKS